MAKSRIINTKFWSDCFIQTLTSEEKLFFLYLLTNEHTEISGIYEISLKTIEFDSGIKQEKILKFLDSLSKAKKVYYVDGYIIIKNFSKHQQTNPKVSEGIKRSFELLPASLRLKLKTVDSLYIDYGSLSHSNSNSNSNSNLSGGEKIPAQNEIKKQSFGEEGTIKLLPEEYKKLRQKIGRQADAYIQKVENWKLSKGKEYKNDYRGILQWISSDKEKGILKIDWGDFQEEDFDTKAEYEKIINKYTK
jgi:hypothetical protein